MKQPLTREGLILAAHSLFDAQMGEPRACMERPVWPDAPDGYELHPEQQPEVFERIVYQTFRYSGATEHEALQMLWDDLKRIWLMSPPRARLYWRLPARISTEFHYREVKVRTRMAFPDSPGVLAVFGTAEGAPGKSDISEYLLDKPWEWR